MNLPPNTTLTLGRPDLSTAYQNILASNIQGTDYVDGFPTTNTGTSTGQYFHLGIDGQNNNMSDLLNVSGTQTGGFNFWTSNSTDAPINLTNITKQGITIDKSVAGTPGIDLPDITASGIAYVIFAASINSPPWNIVGAGNPVSVTQNTAFMTTGVTYYLTAVSSQAGQIFLNSDGTGPIDTSDLFTFPQPILSYGIPTPTVIQKSVLSTDLQITYDTNIGKVGPSRISVEDGTGNISLVEADKVQVVSSTGSTTFNADGFSSTYSTDTGSYNANGLTITDNANNRNTQINSFQTTYQDTANNFTTNIRVPINNLNNYEFLSSSATNSIVSMKASVSNPNLNLTDGTLYSNLSNTTLFFNNTPALHTSELTSEHLLVNDNDQGLSTTINPSLITLDDGATLTNTIGTVSMNIVDTLSSLTALYSVNDIKFNGVSLPAAVSTNTTNIGTNTSNIATNTSNIATNTTNITKNTTSIQKLQYASPLNVCNSTTITGVLPSSPPMKPTPTALLYGYNGWYYKNISATYNNIGWGLALSPSTYTVSQLKGFYFCFVSLTTTSKPFISVYTNPPTAPNYYNSRRSYVPSNSASIVAGTPYIYYFMFDNAYPTPFKYLHTPVALTLSPVNPVGAYAPTENLYYFSVNTNSISTIGNEEIIVSEAGCIIDDGTGTLIQPFSFNSADVYSPNSLAAIVISTNVIRPNVSTNQQVYLNTINSTLVSNDMTGVPAGFYIIIKSAAAIDRTITYNTSSTFTLHTSTGTTNGPQVIAYWTGTQWTIYLA